MIVKSLEITNYGIFNGKYKIDFAEPSIQSITLIGGLNGSGKTTIFEAIQIGLFGAQSNLHKEQGKKRNLSYPKFLASKVNRSAKNNQDTIINLVINLGDDIDIKDDISISRIWKYETEDTHTTKDLLTVEINGDIDTDLTQNWLEFISQIISPSLSKLFFFDGEKILHYAKPENTSTLLIQGIQILLGADLITNLEDDLRLLKRNIVKKSDSVNEDELKDLEDAVVNLRKENTSLQEKLTSLGQDLESANEQNSQINVAFELAGLKTSETVLRLEKDIISLSLQIDNITKIQQFIIAGSLPLMLVKDKIGKIDRESLLLNKINEQKLKVRAWKERDQEFLTMLKSQNKTLHSKFKKSLQESLDKELDTIQEEKSQTFHSTTSDINMLTNEVKKDKSQFEKNLKMLEKLNHQLEQKQKSLLRAPTNGESKKLFNQRDESNKYIYTLELSISKIEESISKNERELLIAENKFKKNFEDTVNSMHASSIQKKQLEKIEITEKSLHKFLNQIVSRSLSQFEDLITEKFNYLIRKDTLVENFNIDQKTYLISASNSQDQTIPLDDLSAGERQILAISILWSLSEVSNIKIPVIIDTPLGRLDSKHRNQLITKYFPEASLQTIILSTDEEIIGKYYKVIKQYAGKEFLCTEHPKIASASTIVKGYF